MFLLVQGKKADLPKRRTPIANIFPSHVFDLQAPEAVLLARSVALGEQEAAAAGAGKPGPAAAKGGAPAGKGPSPGGMPTSHNNEKDFK